MGASADSQWDNLALDSESDEAVEAAEAAMQAAAEAEAEAAEKAEELMETLLDVYDARLNSLTDQIEQLTSTIENTQDVLELTLDNERNRIARLELLLSMAGLCVGTCSAVSGFFGMNLLSGVENVGGLFLLVTGTSILLTGQFRSLFLTCWRQFRSISFRQRDRLMDVAAAAPVEGIPTESRLARRLHRRVDRRGAYPRTRRRAGGRGVGGSVGERSAARSMS